MPEGAAYGVRPVSTVEAAADAVRDLIVSGELPQGSQLGESEFSQRLGIARHTFRAATQILVGEGLLRHRRNRGVVVPIFCQADLEDISRLRIALELEAVRLVIRDGGDLLAAESAVEDLASLPVDTPWYVVARLDLRFHYAVVEATVSTRLLRGYQRVRSETALGLMQVKPNLGAASEIADQHESLLRALESGDVGATTRLWRSHLEVEAA
jgi:DNA-binding GntR family transcriptional regulator